MPPGNNFVFRATRYPENYATFQGRNLTPQGYVENNPYTYSCELFSGLGSKKSPGAGLFVMIYPNPTRDFLRINISNSENSDIFFEMTELSGKSIFTRSLHSGENQIHLPFMVFVE
jgi:hypothetical protein